MISLLGIILIAAQAIAPMSAFHSVMRIKKHHNKKNKIAHLTKTSQKKKNKRVKKSKSSERGSPVRGVALVTTSTPVSQPNLASLVPPAKAAPAQVAPSLERTLIDGEKPSLESGSRLIKSEVVGWGKSVAHTNTLKKSQSGLDFLHSASDPKAKTVKADAAEQFRHKTTKEILIPVTISTDYGDPHISRQPSIENDVGESRDSIGRQILLISGESEQVLPQSRTQIDIVEPGANDSQIGREVSRGLEGSFFGGGSVVSWENLSVERAVTSFEPVYDKEGADDVFRDTLTSPSSDLNDLTESEHEGGIVEMVACDRPASSAHIVVDHNEMSSREVSFCLTGSPCSNDQNGWIPGEGQFGSPISSNLSFDLSEGNDDSQAGLNPFSFENAEGASNEIKTSVSSFSLELVGVASEFSTIANEIKREKVVDAIKRTKIADRLCESTFDHMTGDEGKIPDSEVDESIFDKSMLVDCEGFPEARDQMTPRSKEEKRDLSAEKSLHDHDLSIEGESILNCAEYSELSEPLGLSHGRSFVANGNVIPVTSQDADHLPENIFFDRTGDENLLDGLEASVQMTPPREGVEVKQIIPGMLTSTIKISDLPESHERRLVNGVDKNNQNVASGYKIPDLEVDESIFDKSMLLYNENVPEPSVLIDSIKKSELSGSRGLSHGMRFDEDAELNKTWVPLLDGVELSSRSDENQQQSPENVEEQTFFPEQRQKSEDLVDHFCDTSEIRIKQESDVLSAQSDLGHDHCSSFDLVNIQKELDVLSEQSDLGHDHCSSVNPVNSIECRQSPKERDLSAETSHQDSINLPHSSIQENIEESSTIVGLFRGAGPLETKDPELSHNQNPGAFSRGRLDISSNKKQSGRQTGKTGCKQNSAMGQKRHRSVPGNRNLLDLSGASLLENDTIVSQTNSSKIVFEKKENDEFTNEGLESLQNFYDLLEDCKESFVKKIPMKINRTTYRIKTKVGEVFFDLADREKYDNFRLHCLHVSNELTRILNRPLEELNCWEIIDFFKEKTDFLMTDWMQLSAPFRRKESFDPFGKKLKHFNDKARILYSIHFEKHPECYRLFKV